MREEMKQLIGKISAHIQDGTAYRFADLLHLYPENPQMVHDAVNQMENDGSITAFIDLPRRCLAFRLTNTFKPENTEPAPSVETIETQVPQAEPQPELMVWTGDGQAVIEKGGISLSLDKTETAYVASCLNKILGAAA